ncbi:Mu-like prophage FluMu protein gp41 [Clostridium aceticum]|uniref:Mu-like prophage FluMu protein gp41 n=1 Tax=Clostridium aceticum TaxID=84022 RepID=A0A0D8ID76_9CLOT|nr:phage tail assembly protein [Clostridium aceticum]AKL95017.1 Mu-like prophage FluMu protein gp41 [Clostridium aceticum]KJF27917.1 hypothetical protein TZ02_04895 [Clostridium aceticum]
MVVINKKNKYHVTFRKPYEFEGKTYTEVDLSGIEKLTTNDLVEADKIFASEGNVAGMNEMSVGYACIIASKASHKPLEFFQGLPANEGIKVKNIVVSFFYE